MRSCIPSRRSAAACVPTLPRRRVAAQRALGRLPPLTSPVRLASHAAPQMVAAQRALGFDYVFDTDFAADLTIMEEG